MHTKARSVVVAVLVAMLLLPFGTPRAPVAAAVGPASAMYIDALEPVTSDNATWSVDAPTPPSNLASVKVNPDAGSYYAYGLIGPDNARVAAGVYSDARYPAQPGHPFLSTPPLCGADTTGAFTVYEAEFAADGSPTKLAFDWTNTCTDNGATFSGAVRYNSTWAVKAVWATGSYQVGDAPTGKPVTSHVVVTSTGTAPIFISGIAVSADATGSWSVTGDTCSGRTLDPGTACGFDATVTATAIGPLTATFSIESDGFAPSVGAFHPEARGLIATTLSIRHTGNGPEVGQPVRFEMTVRPAPAGGRFDYSVDGVLRGSVDLDAEGSASVAAGQWAVPGSHTFSAQYVDPSYTSEWSTATINFRLLLHSTTTISTTIARTYVGGTLPTITAHVTGAATTRGGTLRILNNTTGQVLGTVLVTKTSRAITITPTLPVGENLLVAEFSGSLTEAASSSAVFVSVLPDNGVALLKVTVTPTTFYPYQDGYLDTVSIGGTLDEVATVSVAVYNAGGTRVFLANLGSKNGAYSTTWNGRNGSGAMLPAGAYNVVQTLHDTTGHSRTENTSVTLSQKHLETSTVYVTKTVAQAAVVTPAWIGWDFTLPSATIYKSLQFQVYGRSILVPGMWQGVWDFRDCPPDATFDPSCVRTWTGVPFVLGWSPSPMSTTNNRHDRTVRGFAIASGSGELSQARVKVTYGVLKP